MADNRDTDDLNFSFRGPSILTEEIRYTDIFKANLTDKMFRFTTRANVILSQYSMLLVRNSDRSHTHLVYRTRNKARSKIQTFSALIDHLNKNEIEYDSKKLIAIEIFRLDVNDEWARMEYGRLRTLAYMDGFKETESLFPEDVQDFLKSSPSTIFDGLAVETSD